MSICTRSDDTNDQGKHIGCIKSAGHKGRCTVRTEPDAKYHDTDNAEADSDAGSQGQVDPVEDDEVAQEEAEVQWGVAYEACMGLGMSHFRYGDTDCFLNPHNGRVVQITAGSSVRRCEIRPV